MTKMVCPLCWKKQEEREVVACLVAHNKKLNQRLDDLNYEIIALKFEKRKEAEI